MTNLLFRWNGNVSANDGHKEVKLTSVYFFTKTGEFLLFPIDNIIGCWIKLDGDYSIKVRNKVETSRNEVFAVKSNVKGFCDLYIPFEAAGGQILGEEVKTFSDGDFEYKYNTYLVNGSGLIEFTEGKIDVERYDEDVLKVYAYLSHKATKQYQKLSKLRYEIEKECGVCIGGYELKNILKKYRIVKRKNSE